jgi:hypothetical protein
MTTRTQFIPLIIVVLLIALGTGYYLTQGTGAATEDAVLTEPTDIVAEQSAVDPMAADAEKFTGSFTDFIARGGSWKCSIDPAAPASQAIGGVTGMAYVANGKVRADLRIKTQNEQKEVVYGETHVITDGIYVYAWAPTVAQGYKLKLASIQGTWDEESGNPTFTYDCQPWSSTASLFVLPNITFVEEQRRN